jgi:hypothetical protein
VAECKAWAETLGPDGLTLNAGLGVNTPKYEMAPWPLPKVWLGTSVEDQATADERIPLLLQTPAAVRFVSYEPALGPVDFAHLQPERMVEVDALGGTHGVVRPHRGTSARLDWVIVGGESGPGARPFNIAWARSTVAQCRAAAVPVFVKQFGGRPYLHEQTSFHHEGPGFSAHIESLEIKTTVTLRDRKGGDMAEWPEDLRVREFPGERA